MSVQFELFLPMSRFIIDSTALCVHLHSTWTYKQKQTVALVVISFFHDILELNTAGRIMPEPINSNVC